MSSPLARVGIVFVAVVVTASILVLVGGGKLSTAQTAQRLKRVVTPRSKVSCVKGSWGWDYSCRVTPARGSGMTPFTTLVEVDSNRIVDLGG